MATYVRQSSFSDGDTITAALFNNEFNQLVNAFDVATGHTHDGSTAGDGGPISNLFSNALVFGTNTDNDVVITFNANSNDGVLTWMEDEDYFQFSDDLLLTTTEKVQFRDTAIYINSSTDGQLDIVADTEVQIVATTIDMNGNADISGNLGVGGNLTVTGTTTFNGGTITMGDAATDNVVFGADVDSNIIPDDDDSYDLGSSTQEWRNLYIDGTANIDSLIADTADINGGTIDATNITVGSGKTLDVSAGTLTLADNQISGDKVEGGTINATTINTLTYGSITDGTITVTAFVDEDNMASNSATLIPTQQSVKAYVDAQDTAQDLDLVSDSGTIAIDLDGETLTVTGGEGIDTSASTNTLTITGEDATTSNKGIASFNSDDFNVSSGVVTLATTSTAAELNILDGKAFLDEDDMSSNSATGIASQQSIKAYVDTTVAATNEVVEDTTPQLGGDLDLNSSDITGTGNINITGTIQSSGDITGTLATAAQPNITSVGTLTALTVDDITINGSTISDTGNLTLDVGGEIILDADGTGVVQFVDAGAEFGRIYGSNNNLNIKSTISNEDILFIGNDGGSTITALTLDMSAAGAATFNAGANFGSGIDVTGTVTSDGLTVSNSSYAQPVLSVTNTSTGGYGAYINTSGFSSSHHSLRVDRNNGKQALRVDGAGDISFYDNTGTTAALFWDASAESLGIGTTSPSATLDISDSFGAINLESSTGTNQVQVKVLNTGGAAFFGKDNSAGSWFGTGEAYATTLRSDGAYPMIFRVNGGNRLVLDDGGNVGIGTDSPSSKLHVIDSSTADSKVLRLSNAYTTDAANDAAGIMFGLYRSYASSVTDSGFIKSVKEQAWDASSDRDAALTFGTRDGASEPAERMRIDSSGNVGIGTASPDHSLRVVGDARLGNLHFKTSDFGTGGTGKTIYADGAGTGVLGFISTTAFDFSNGSSSRVRIDSSGNVGIGATSPDGNLHVSSGSAGTVTASSDANELVLEAATNVGMTLLTGNSSIARIRFGDADSNARGNIFYNHSNDSLGLQTAASTAMTIDSSGRVGIGTSSPAANLEVVDPVSGNFSGEIRVGGIGSSRRLLLRQDSATEYTIGAQGSSALLKFAVGNTPTEAMRIDSSGNLGIGTTSPSEKLSINNSSGNAYLQCLSGNGNLGGVWVGDQADEYVGAFLYDNNVDASLFYTNNAERMRIDSSGNVGIGTSSPSEKLQIDGNVRLGPAHTTRVGTDGTNAYFENFANGAVIFRNNGYTERMRIDSSGNLLVGTTDTSLWNNGASGNTGTVIESDGTIQIAKSNNITAYFNRLDGDGDIVSFRKDGSAVGSIGTRATYLTIGSGDVGLMFNSGSNRIQPENVDTGALTDNLVDLGYSGGRFKDLYLSGGVHLGGTGSANKLDDYEEGTWTPAYNNGGSIAYTTQYGSYVKIGRLVHLACNIDVDTVSGTNSGAMQISGAPFTNDGVDETGGSVGINLSGWLNGSGSDTIQINATNASILPAKDTINDIYRGTDIGTGFVRWTIVYMTDQ